MKFFLRDEARQRAVMEIILRWGGLPGEFPVTQQTFAGKDPESTGYMVGALGLAACKGAAIDLAPFSSHLGMFFQPMVELFEARETSVEAVDAWIARYAAMGKVGHA